MLSAGAGVLGLAVGLRAARRAQALDLAGRVVMITGGSRGLGLALARGFADRGARLALLARDAAELERAEDDLLTRGGEALTIRCDITDRDTLRAAVDQAARHYGRLDVLVNNAGIMQVGPIEHMRVEDFEEAMAVHVWASLNATLAALPHMRAQGGGRIVNVTSIGGKIAAPHMAPYSVSKFAQVGLSEALRAELTKEGILVTTVCPGLLRTGSPVNASFKGRYADEFAWFALLDSLPVVSADARRAAQRIIEACRVGRARLVITPQARLAIVLNDLFPELFAAGVALFDRLLPGAVPGGERAHSGWEGRAQGGASRLGYLGDRAIEDLNELGGRDSLR